MKHFLSFLCLLGATPLVAQNSLDTFEACDANLDGSVSVADATSVVNHALYATSPGAQVVTAEQLNNVLQKIEGELAALRSHAGLPEPGGSAPSANAYFQFTSKSLHIGDTFTQEVSTTSDGAVSYLSTNPSAATVNATSGLVTAVANGETTIIATITATSNYPVTSAAYNIIVEAENMHNGHEYVDLGLKDEQGRTIYWATCNVGADKMEDAGDYYCWGETSTKPISQYKLEYYKYYKSETVIGDDGFDVDYSGYTKYVFAKNNGGYKGYHDEKSVLDLEDDAARFNWKGLWRTPTAEEGTLLMNNCQWEKKTLNGVVGFKVTGINGNWIFVPIAGCYYKRGYTDEGAGGKLGYLMTSSLLEYTNSEYSSIFFYSNGGHTNSHESRSNGIPIRPVCILEK